MKSKNRVSNIGTLAAVVMKSFAPFMGLFALVVAAGCGGGSPIVTPPRHVPAAISATIPVGTSPRAIAVDSVNNKIYVADFGTQPTLGPLPCSPTSGNVTVIDGATQSPTPVLFSTGYQLNPVAIALNPASHTVYVVARDFGPGLSGKGCSHLIDGVEAIDASTLLDTGAIYRWPDLSVTVGRVGIDVNQVTGDVYVAHTQLGPNNIVAVIDSSGLTTIPVGTAPVGVAVNATTNKIYVANSGSNDISVIDGTTNSVTGTITDPMAVAPSAVAVNPTTDTIYIANSDSNNLTVIDGATATVTATVPVGTSPSGVAVDAERNVIYVANASNSQTGSPGNVTVIDGVTNTTTTLTDPKAMNPVAVAVNSATNKTYVANSGSNNVTVIDGAH